MTSQIGQPRASGLLGKVGFPASMPQVKKHRRILKPAAPTVMSFYTSFPPFLTLAPSLPNLSSSPFSSSPPALLPAAAAARPNLPRSRSPPERMQPSPLPRRRSRCRPALRRGPPRTEGPRGPRCGRPPAPPRPLGPPPLHPLPRRHHPAERSCPTCPTAPSTSSPMTLRIRPCPPRRRKLSPTRKAGRSSPRGGLCEADPGEGDPGVLTASSCLSCTVFV